MFGFLSVLLFPLLMGIGFAGVFFLLSLLVPQRASAIMERSGGQFYLAFLTIPMLIVLIDSYLDGTLSCMGMRLPAILSQETCFAVLAGAAVAVVTGGLLFYNELYVSIALRRLMNRLNPRAGVLMDGKSSSLTRQSTAFVPFMGISLYICFAEELLWRGFLPWYLTAEFEWSAWAAVLVSSVLFGFNHIYFGLRNMMLKTLDGIVWSVLLFATSSLLIPFLSHLTFQIFVWRRLQWQAGRGQPIDDHQVSPSV